MPEELFSAPTAASKGLALCKACHHLQPCPPATVRHCERCGEALSMRKPYSLARCWFFLFLSIMMLVPANILPMMDIQMFNRPDPSTIIGGVALLVHHGIYGIALVVFVASFIVPLGKITCIIVWLLSVQYGWDMSHVTRMKVYRGVEFIGRWSMLDVFVVAVMVGLVHLGQVVTVVPGTGTISFGLSVVLTMLASMSFDPRLIWDARPDSASTPIAAPSRLQSSPVTTQPTVPHDE